MSRYIPEHPKKGTAEAYAWAEKMRAARQKKARLKHQIRQAGLKVEQEFFGPGGPLAPKATRKHSLNPSKSYSLVCQANGCTFHREHLSKKQANQEATGHMNMYGHSVAIVEKNPGAKWHQGEEDVAYRYKKDAKDQLEKAFFAGVEAAHKTSGSAARKMGMNPLRKSKPEWFYDTASQSYILDLGKGGGYQIRRQGNAYRYSFVIGSEVQYIRDAGTVKEAMDSIDRTYGKKFKRQNEKVKRNPIAVFNPPKVAGTIYNNAIEIKAQKTGGPLKGHYKHIFDSKKVKILGLTDGTVLLQHTEGKPLWITEKDYERSGRKH